METIVSSLITGAVALVVCLINNKKQNDLMAQQHQENINLMSYKLEELSKRVEKHNSVIERTYKLESDAAVLQEQIKVANHRIEDLENVNP